MSQETNRLLMELERSMRAVNREVINPQVQQLTIDDLRPLLSLVAGARARYIRALLDLSATAKDGRPGEPQLAELARLRHEYDELASGAKALETAIQRGYLDVQVNPR